MTDGLDLEGGRNTTADLMVTSFYDIKLIWSRKYWSIFESLAKLLVLVFFTFDHLSQHNPRI